MFELTPLLLLLLIFCSVRLASGLADRLKQSALSKLEYGHLVTVYGDFVSLISLMCRWCSAFCVLGLFIYALTDPAVASSANESGFPGWAFVYSKCASLVEAAHANHVLWYIIPFILSQCAIYIAYRFGVALRYKDSFKE